VPARAPVRKCARKENPMDLQDEINALEMAEHDIEIAKKNISHQKTIVRKFETHGHNASSARALLATMQDTLAVIEAHRTLVLSRIDKMKRGMN
jgi:hypothetical protein